MDFTTPWGPLNPRSPHPDLAAFRHTRFHTYHALPRIHVYFAHFCILRSNSTLTKFSLSFFLFFGIDANFYLYSVHRVDKAVHKAVIP